VKAAFSQNSRAGLETLAGLIQSAALKPVIDRVYPMAQIAEAHRHVEGRHKRGSVVISIDPLPA
jgi:NADPH:quinone reductase-like Zn-dependent oxidoreductase